MMAAAAAWLAAGALADIELYAPEADTLATVTARGATSAQSLTLTGSTPLTLGADAATNTAGWLKLWGAGANDFYTTITAGTQTQVVAYTLPADDGDAGEFLKTDGNGALSWDAAGGAEADTLATVTARGATSALSLTLTGATPLALGEDVAGGTSNVPGYLKLWSNGDNAFAATLTAGTMTAAGDWTWFTALPAGAYLVNCSAAGALGYTDPATFAAAAHNHDAAYLNDDGDTATGSFDFTGAVLSGASPLVFEGATANDFETTLAVEDPTTPDKTVTIPNLTGTLLVDSAENAGNVTILGTLGLGKDDDTSTLTIHHAGTLVFNDASDDTTVTFGPVGDGTTILGVTGTINASGLQVGGNAVLTSEADTLGTVTGRGATAAVALVLDDGAGDSPAVEWVCAGDKKLALSKLDAGDGLVLNDEGGLQLQLSNDTDDYLVLSTAADVPTIATAGACNLTIAPDGGTTNVTGALAASGDLTGNGGLGVDLISQAVAVADFTDNTDATGYIDLTPKLPAGAIVLGWECVVTAGFTGDTSATVQVGVEGTLDKYSATTANSVLVDDTTVGSSVKDGNVYCAAVTTVRVTVTGDADFTSIKTANHGAMTVKVFYICTP